MTTLSRALLLATIIGLTQPCHCFGQDLNKLVVQLQDNVEIERDAVDAATKLLLAEGKSNVVASLARQIKETGVDVVHVIGLYTVSNMLTNIRVKGPLRKAIQLNGEPIPEGNLVDGGISPDYIVEMFGSAMQKDSRFRQSMEKYLEENEDDGVLRLLQATVKNYSQDGLDAQREQQDDRWSFPWCVLVGCEE